MATGLSGQSLNLGKVGGIVAAPLTGGISLIPQLTGPGKTGPNVGGNMGSYGEGNVMNALTQLQQLKAAVQSGQVTLADYQDQASKLVQQAAQITGQISSSGSKAASAVNPIWSQITSGGFATNINGKWTAPLPFSRQEYAKLPNNVLPTQDDINTGLFDPSTAPVQRVQTAPTPTDKPNTPNTPTNGPQAPQPSTQPAAPAPSFTPTNPAQTAPAPVTAGNNAATGVAPTTGNSQVLGAPVYSANPNNPGPNGGLVQNGTQAGMDSTQIANEAALQQQLSTQSQQGVTAQRSKYLNDLSDILTKRNQTQMAYDSPGIYEDLNSRGLLRSSGLGEAMGRESAKLNADTTSQLAQAGVSGATTDLGNLTTIQNTYNQGRNSALQRQFSVEDYNNQLAAGKALGDTYAAIKPQTPSTKAQGTQTAAALAPAAATIATK